MKKGAKIHLSWNERKTNDKHSITEYIGPKRRIIKLSTDQRTFTWASNDRKLMTVPFDEHPYSAMAQFFKTDEGLEVFKSIEKKLK